MNASLPYQSVVPQARRLLYLALAAMYCWGSLALFAGGVLFAWACLLFVSALTDASASWTPVLALLSGAVLLLVAAIRLMILTLQYQSGSHFKLLTLVDEFATYTRLVLMAYALVVVFALIELITTAAGSPRYWPAIWAVSTPLVVAMVVTRRYVSHASVQWIRAWCGVHDVVH